MRARRLLLTRYLAADGGAGAGGFGPMGGDPSTVQARAGMVLAGRYGLVEPIASGGMAQVWLGEDMALVRQVAIKILHPHLAVDQGFVTRFRREAVASARLSHPSIVAVYDTVSEAGIEAIVMELIEGRTLRAILNEVGVLPASDVVDVGVQISDALDTAHRAGIVHRDIKPANIMVSTDRRILVTDFGIAKANRDADLTHTGTLLGTAKYLAPEQVAGEPIDPRADIYSLGVVLYEAATGFPPFLAETDAGTALARLQGEVPRCRHRRPSVPVGLDEVIARSMARSPDNRFDRAASFRAALAGVDLTDVRLDTSDLGPAIGAAVGTAPGGAAVAGEALGGPAQPVAPPGVGPNPGAPGPPAVSPPVGHAGTSVLPQGSVPATDGPATARRRGRAARKKGKRARRASKATKVPPSGRPNKRAADGAMLPIDGRQRPTKTLAATLIIVGLVVAGLLLAAVVGNTATSVPIASAAAFDPLGSGDELDDLAPNAIDGDDSSAWRTESYRLQGLSNLKDGVGLILELEEPGELREISLLTGTEGWAAEIWVAGERFGPDDASFTTDAYEGPAAVIETGGQRETVSLRGASGSHVLIWLSDTGTTDDPDEGPKFRFDLYEVSVR